MKTTFSLLTFNCFGGLHWTTPRRLRALGQELDRLAPEVVCLQEVQTHAARRLLQRVCAGHPAHAYVLGRRAPLGSLLTLGRAPLSPPYFARYTTQGSWYTLTLMDRITQKGALVAQIWHEGVEIIVVNTHLVANYGANWRTESRAARAQQSQLHELAALVAALPATALVLVAGDFNIPRGSWLYEEFLQRSGLADPLAGDGRPTYRPLPGVPARYALPIDFVFVRAPSQLDLHTEPALYFTEKLALGGARPGYLSDHLGVRMTLRWEVGSRE